MQLVSLNRVLRIGLTLLVAGVCVGAVLLLRGDLESLQLDQLQCTEDTPQGTRAFDFCAQAAADRFYKVDYSEAKDLAKSFLTLLTAVFVASVTFSEKIISVTTAGLWGRSSMLLCWALLLLAIVMCGTALVYMIFGLGFITYARMRPTMHENRALFLFTVSGISFGLALCAMLLAGIPSLFEKRGAYKGVKDT